MRRSKYSFRAQPLLFIAVLWVGTGCGCLPADQLYAAASQEAQALRALFREAGVQFPCDSFPLSKRDLYSCAVWLRSQTHNSSTASKISSYLSSLTYQPGTLNLDMYHALVYERYDSTEDHPMTFAEKLAYVDPLLQANWYFGGDGGGSFYVQGGIYKDYDEDGAQNIPEPKYRKPLAFSNNFIRQAYIYVPFGFGDATFGRQQLQIGPSELLTGLTVSERLPYFDALRLRFFIGRFTMTEIISALENRRASQDVTIPGPPDSSYTFGNNIIFYNIHYFEYAWKHLRVGIGAQMLLSRPYNMFNLGDFFPIFSWHQGDIGVNNLCGLMDLTITPFSGVELYFQGGLDDVDLSAIGLWDRDDVPTVWAGLAGVRASCDIFGVPTKATAEVGQTHYLWGNYSWPGKVGDNILSRAIYRMRTDYYADSSVPLTSPYGPGTRWLIAQIEAGSRSGISGSLRFTALQQNPLANLYTTPYQMNDEIANNPYTTTFTYETAVTCALGNFAEITVNPRFITRSGDSWRQVFLHVCIHHDYHTTVHARALQQ